MHSDPRKQIHFWIHPNVTKITVNRRKMIQLTKIRRAAEKNFYKFLENRIMNEWEATYLSKVRKLQPWEPGERAVSKTLVTSPRGSPSTRQGGGREWGWSWKTSSGIKDTTLGHSPHPCLILISQEPGTPLFLASHTSGHSPDPVTTWQTHQFCSHSFCWRELVSRLFLDVGGLGDTKQGPHWLPTTLPCCKGRHAFWWPNSSICHTL